VFFLRGFSPDTHIINRRLPRSLIISALITFTLLAPLTYYSVKFFQQANENRLINEVVNAEVARLKAELVELNVTHLANKFDMIITVRTSTALRYEQVTALQRAIVDELQFPVSLKVNQIFAERLDPLIPPTQTLTPTLTPTNTPGPSPTVTATATPGRQVSGGLIWIEVMDSDGRIGWIPEIYLLMVTATPSN